MSAPPPPAYNTVGPPPAPAEPGKTDYLPPPYGQPTGQPVGFQQQQYGLVTGQPMSAGYPAQPGYPGGYPSQPAQPGYPMHQHGQVGYAPGAPVTTVLVTRFGQDPVRTKCQSCHADVLTTVDYRVSLFTWLVCGGICLTQIGALGCCFIPFCLRGCKDAVHRCPNCNFVCGTYSPMN